MAAAAAEAEAVRGDELKHEQEEQREAKPSQVGFWWAPRGAATELGSAATAARHDLMKREHKDWRELKAGHCAIL
jgi:hypothetical protein